MEQMHVSNDALGDPAALSAAWARDGYWYFKNVIDLGAVERLRAHFVDELAKFDLVNPKDPALRLRTSNLDAVPKRVYGLEILAKNNIWETFVKEPAVNDFFAELVNDQPFWLPIVEYRAVPPSDTAGHSRKAYVHQDSFYNQGIDFYTCWFPLTSVDPDVGGIAIAEGYHAGACLHDLGNPPSFPIPEDAIPESDWRTANFEPGDVLVMSLNMPHTGLTNVSDRFRISMDARFMPASGNVPAIGEIAELNEQRISVRLRNGEERSFKLDEGTYCRGALTARLTPTELVDAMNIGDSVIVAGEAGRATVVRPAH